MISGTNLSRIIHVLGHNMKEVEGVPWSLEFSKWLPSFQEGKVEIPIETKEGMSTKESINPDLPGRKLKYPTQKLRGLTILHPRLRAGEIEVVQCRLDRSWSFRYFPSAFFADKTSSTGIHCLLKFSLKRSRFSLRSRPWCFGKHPTLLQSMIKWSRGCYSTPINQNGASYCHRLGLQ